MSEEGGEGGGGGGGGTARDEILTFLGLKGVENFISGFGEVKAAFKDLKDGSSGLSDGLKKMGESLTSMATVPLLEFGKELYNSAADMQVIKDTTASVFGDSSKEMEEWAEKSARDLGMGAAEALKTTDAFGLMATGLGALPSVAADQSEALTKLTADMASYAGVDPGQVNDKLTAALKGSAKSLKSFGIDLGQGTLQAEALKEGLGDNLKALTPLQLEQIRYNAIMAQSGQYSDAFNKNMGRGREASLVFHAEISNLKDSLGQALYPRMVQVINIGSDLMEKFTAICAPIRNLIVLFGAIVAAIGPAIFIFGEIIAVFGTLASPIGLVILAIAALGYAYKTNLFGFRDAVKSVIGTVVPIFQEAVRVVGLIAHAISMAFSGTGHFSDMLKGVPAPLRRFKMAIIEVVKAIGLLVHGFQAGGLAGMMAELPHATNLFRDALYNLRDILGTIITQIGKDLLNAFLAIDWGAAAVGVLNFTIAFLGYLGDLLGAIPGILGTLLEQIHTGFAPLDNILHDIGQYWKDLGALITDVMHGSWSKVLDDLKHIGQDMIHYVEDLGKLILTAFEAIPFGEIGSFLLSAGITLAEDIYNGIVDNMPGADQFLNALSAIGGYIMDAIRTSIDALWKAGGKVYDWLTGFAGKVFDALPGADKFVSALSTIGGLILDAVLASITALWNAAGKLFGWLAGFADQVFSALPLAGVFTSALSPVGGFILDAVKASLDTLWAAGGALYDWFHGFADKIVGALPTSWDAIKGAFQGLLNILDDVTAPLSTAVELLKSAGSFLGLGGGSGSDNSGSGQGSPSNVGTPQTGQGDAQGTTQTTLQNITAGTFDGSGALASITTWVENVTAQLAKLAGYLVFAAATPSSGSPAGAGATTAEMHPPAFVPGSTLSAIQTFCTNVGKAFDDMHTKVSLAMSASSGIGYVAMTAATYIRDTVGPIAVTAATNIAKAFDMSSGMAYKVTLNFGTMYTNAKQKTDDLNTNLPDIAGKAATGIMDHFGAGSTGMQYKVSNNFITMYNNAKDTLSNDMLVNLPDYAAEVAIGIANKFGDHGPGSMIFDVATHMTDFQNIVQNGITAIQTAAYNDAYNVGYSIGSGINAGMAFWLNSGAIAATAAALVNAAITAGNQTAKSASPSERTTETGSNLGEGYLVGMAGWGDAIADQARKLINGAVNAATRVVGTGASSIGALALTGGNFSSVAPGAAGSSSSTVLSQTNHVTIDVRGFDDLVKAASIAAALPVAWQQVRRSKA